MSFLHRRLVPALVLTTLAAPFAGCTHPAEEAQVVLEARLSGQLVISQVYGGGGNSMAPYTNDFIEIFNRSTSAVSLNGLSVQYASSTGNFQASQTVALPNVNLEAGQYFLVGLSGGTTGVALPTPDVTGTINMSGTAGKVALVDGTTVVPCTSGVCTLTNVIDLVGYGTAASQYEGMASATAPSNNTTSVQRRTAGCTETDDNRADFESPVLAVAPRNTATARNVCATTGTDAGADADDVVDAAADVVDVVDAATDVMDAGTDSGSDGGTVVVPTGLVISQVYGAGGNAGATFTNDFVELFNLSSAPISLNGLSIQYASSAGNFQMTNVVALPDVVVQPGHYFLISLAAGANGMPLPTADLSNTMVNMASGAGRVALVAGTTAIPCTAGVCTLTNVIDYVGYGATASQYEGTGAAPAPSMTSQSMQRRGAGCVDTNDNAADFEVLATNPRNSASAANDCSMVTTDAGSDASVDADDASMTDTGVDATVDTGTDSGSSMDATVDAGPIDATGLVISQVYGGGGNSMAAYTNDYVEIFNRGTMPISLSGLSLQYASSAGNFQASGVTVLPAATIPVGGYFLVQLASSGAVGLALPGSDFSNTTVNLSGSAGKVALVIGTTALGCGGTTLCSSTNIVDLVGYGAAATYYEGTGPTGAASSNTNSIQRLRAGCVDTNDNSVDFEMPTRAATPRSSTSPLNDCSITPPVDAGPMDTGVDVPMVDAARDTGTDVPRVDVVDVATDVPRDVPSSDTGVDSGVDAGTPDAGRVDAGGTDARADAARDGSRDGAADAGNTMNPSGCGCSTPGTERARSPFALLAAVAAVGVVRRRRRAVV